MTSQVRVETVTSSVYVETMTESKEERTSEPTNRRRLRTIPELNVFNAKKILFKIENDETK